MDTKDKVEQDTPWSGTGKRWYTTIQASDCLLIVKQTPFWFRRKRK